MVKKFSLDIVYYGFSQVGRALIPFIMLPILTRYISTKDYGVLSIIEVFILFLFPIISLNIHSAINVQYFKIKKRDLGYYIVNAFKLVFITFFIIEILFLLLGEVLQKAFHIDYEIIVLLPFLALLRVAPQVMLSLYQAMQKAKEYLFFTLSQAAVDFILSTLFVVVLLLGYIGRLEGVYIALAIFSVLTYYILKKEKLLKNINSKYTKDILNYGLFLIPHAISGVVMAMSDRYFISYYYDNSYVGLYTVAYQIGAIILLVGTSVNKAWSVFLFKVLKTNMQKNTIWKFIVSIYVFFIFISIVVYLLKDMIFSLMVSNEFIASKEYFGYLLIGFLFQILYMIITNFLFYYEKTKFLSILTLSGAVLNIILNYILILKLGVVGVAIATAITWFYYFVIVLIVVLKNQSKWRYEA